MSTTALAFAMLWNTVAAPSLASPGLVLRPGYVKARIGPLTVFLATNGALTIRRGPMLLGQGGFRTSNDWGHWQPLWRTRGAAPQVRQRTAKFEAKRYRETCTMREDGKLHVSFELMPGDSSFEFLAIGFEMPTKPFVGTSVTGAPAGPEVTLAEQADPDGNFTKKLKSLAVGSGSENQVRLVFDEPYVVDVSDRRLTGQDVLLILVHATPTMIDEKPGGKVGFTIGP